MVMDRNKKRGETHLLLFMQEGSIVTLGTHPIALRWPNYEVLQHFAPLNLDDFRVLNPGDPEIMGIPDEWPSTTYPGPCTVSLLESD